MPSAFVQIDILNQFAVAPDEQVGGDAQIRDGSEVGVDVRVEPILEQGVDPWPAEFARRQADAVDHQQVDVGALGTFVPVGGEDPPGTRQPAYISFNKRLAVDFSISLRNDCSVCIKASSSLVRGTSKRSSPSSSIASIMKPIRN